MQTLTARERSRISNQTVCSLLEMLRLVARSNSSALINIRRPPPGHPHSQTWFMDTLWAVQKSGISQKRVRSSMLGMEALTQIPGTRGKLTLRDTDIKNTGAGLSELQQTACCSRSLAFMVGGLVSLLALQVV